MPVFQKKYRQILATLLTLSLPFTTQAMVIPGNNSDFYYKLGGGQDVPLPAFWDTTYIPINVGGDIGLGFDCGAFNPTFSLRNSLNQIKSSFIAVEQKVVNSAKAAITELPLYIISRADPSLYNLINNAIAGVEKNIAISTKSCEVMQSQIAAGQNPYAHWMTISMGNTWRKEIGTASLSGTGDINQARDKVGKDAGRSGVPWVSGSGSTFTASYNGDTLHAGGVNQPPIHVIHDTVVTGFHVIQQGGSGKSDLTATWKSAEIAAKWVVHVVGDQTVTTYDSGEKSSTPGVGLYTEIEAESQKLLPKLQQLVTGQMLPSIENLSSVSTSSISVTKEMIQTIQSQSPVLQNIVINKLAQNIAALQVMDKARLSMRLLQTGSEVPAIYSNKAAQIRLHIAQQKLKNDVSNMLLFLNAKSQLAAHLMDIIMQHGANDRYANTAVSVSNRDAANLYNGAVSKK